VDAVPHEHHLQEEQAQTHMGNYVHPNV
jgi:hypothetical protein